jgi:neutral ceramidase
MSSIVQCSLGVLVALSIGVTPAGSIPQDGSAPSGRTPAVQTRPGWSAGVARVVVTPADPIFMKGYPSRTKPSEGVRQDLLVKALALRDESGATSVLVTSDLHSYTRRMSDTIAEAAEKKYGLPRSRLILNGSHTHSGPAVTAEPWLRPAEDINPAQEAVIRRYTARG